MYFHRTRGGRASEKLQHRDLIPDGFPDGFQNVLKFGSISSRGGWACFEKW